MFAQQLQVHNFNSTQYSVCRHFVKKFHYLRVFFFSSLYFLLVCLVYYILLRIGYLNWSFGFLSYTIIQSCRPVKYSCTFFYLFLYACMYFLTDREICEKRGTNIPIGLYRQCFNAFIAFPTSNGDKEKKTSSSIVIGLVYRQKGGIHHVMKMIENSLPVYRCIVILLRDTYTPYVW